MHSSPAVSRVAVIGGGVFGVSSAVHLARRGASVTLVTDGAPASGASGRSLSWLNSSRMRSPEYHRLRMIGIDRYRTLAARHPDADWLRFDGGLTWDADDASNEIAAAYAHERSIGYDALLLAADEIPAVTPGVDTRTIPRQGAIFNPGEGWVDLPSLVEVLLGEFAARGGRLVTDAGRASVDVVGGRATGVRTSDGGRFAADAVLLPPDPRSRRSSPRSGFTSRTRPRSRSSSGPSPSTSPCAPSSTRPGSPSDAIPRAPSCSTPPGRRRRS